MYDSLKRVWRFVRRELAVRLRSLLQRHPIASPVVLVLLVVGFVAASFYTDDAAFYESLLEGTLNQSTEPTGSSLKGLDALLATQFPRCIKKDLSETEISGELARALKETSDAIAAASRTCVKDCGKTLTVGLLQPPEVQEPLVTDDLETFLFLPARLVPHLRTMVLSRQQIDKTEALSDLEIRRAVVLSQSIAPALTRMLEVPVFAPGPDAPLDNTGQCEKVSHQAALDPRPVQVYFIHEYGLNRIAGRHGDGPLSKGYYVRQFPAATYFPGRPYYVGAVSRPGADGPLLTASGTIGSFFYVSEPYFDLAGNGLVVTLARAFTDPVLGRGVICFDVGLKPGFDGGAVPIGLLDRLGSVARNVDCSIPSASRERPSCTVRPDQPARTAFQRKDDALQQRFVFTQTKLIASHRASLAQVTGSLQVLDSEYQPRPTQHTGRFAGLRNYLGRRSSSFTSWVGQFVGLDENARQMIISIPTSPPTFEQKGGGDVWQSSSFTVFNLDLPGFRRQTVVAGAIALIAFLGSLGVILFVWELDSRTSREMADALRRISQVMTNSGIAFAWLDQRDQIVRASTAFLHALGFQSLEHLRSVHPGMTFASLIADESEEDYQRVERLRAAGKPVAPYPLVFVRADNTHATFTIVSASVPSRKSLWSAIPETFGVLLEGNVQIEAEID